MTRSTTAPRTLSLAAAALALMLPAAAATAQVTASANATAREWSDTVWATALDGYEDSLFSLFDQIPAAADEQQALRFRTALSQLRANEQSRAAARDVARNEALDKMKSQIAEGDQYQALATAVEVQSRSEDFDDIFTNNDINALISWAARQEPLAEAQNDWLYARDLLFLLRTLHEDTDRTDTYERYRDELERVNKRVALIARYAPKRLYDLRQQRATRLGEDPLPEYNEASAADWKERIEGVSKTILTESLGRAATEHVERRGWRPMLAGGLESVRLLATTGSLSETFPGLGSTRDVNRFTDVVDDLSNRLIDTPDRDLDRWSASAILDKLLAANDDSIRLPWQVLFQEYGDGAVETLDRYSEIIWPEKLRRFNQAVVGNFVGVGILIRHNERRDIMVVNPLEGAPAYFGGVRPDDLIMEVNGESTVGWSLNDAVDQITGKPDTQVTLGIQREGVDGILPITLTRKLIKIRSVKGWWKEGLSENGAPKWNWYADPDAGIAYIRLTQFTDDTYHDFRNAWKQINETGNPTGLILDLRFNPGGLLTSAVDMSNLFIKRGVIVSGEDRNGQRAWPDQTAKPFLAELAGVPTVVLINKGSASASEIVSGCLQAHEAAVVLGDRSFGKGSVQTVHPITRESRRAETRASKLKLTTHYYRLPSPDGGITAGAFVHRREGASDADEWGVTPDITIRMNDHQVAEALELRQQADLIPDEIGEEPADELAERVDINRLITEGIDTQLEAALLILRTQAIGRGHLQHLGMNPKE